MSACPNQGTEIYTNARCARRDTANIFFKFWNTSPHPQLVSAPEPRRGSMTSHRQKCISVRRRQLPCCAGFAITDYRSQGRTFNNIILNLELLIKIAGGHYTYSAICTVCTVARARCQGYHFFEHFCRQHFLQSQMPHLRMR